MAIDKLTADGMQHFLRDTMTLWSTLRGILISDKAWGNLDKSSQSACCVFFSVHSITLIKDVIASLFSHGLICVPGSCTEHVILSLVSFDLATGTLDRHRKQISCMNRQAKRNLHGDATAFIVQ